MKKNLRRGICFLIMSIMIFGSVSLVSAASMPSINSNSSKEIYKVYNYRSGDCNLSANTYMIKRKAILLKRSDYKDIKNDTSPSALNGGNGSVRKAACMNGSYPYNYNDVLFTYTFKKGKIYTIKSGTLSGSAAIKRNTIKALLKKHPEGVVVWGPNCTKYGSHGILAAYVNKRGTIMYVDSAHNTWTNNTKRGGHNSRMNKGFETIDNTIVYGEGSLTRYWYISNVK